MHKDIKIQDKKFKKMEKEMMINTNKVEPKISPKMNPDGAYSPKISQMNNTAGPGSFSLKATMTAQGTRRNNMME